MISNISGVEVAQSTVLTVLPNSPRSPGLGLSIFFVEEETRQSQKLLRAKLQFRLFGFGERCVIGAEGVDRVVAGMEREVFLSCGWVVIGWWVGTVVLFCHCALLRIFGLFEVF